MVSSFPGSAAGDDSQPDKDGDLRQLTTETIDELEWCLEQLETVQTHRSVSDMASLKVQSHKEYPFLEGFSRSKPVTLVFRIHLFGADMKSGSRSGLH